MQEENGRHSTQWTALYDEGNMHNQRETVTDDTQDDNRTPTYFVYLPTRVDDRDQIECHLLEYSDDREDVLQALSLFLHSFQECVRDRKRERLCVCVCVK